MNKMIDSIKTKFKISWGYRLFTNIKGLCLSLLSTRIEPKQNRKFHGYFSYYFAVKYANRRYEWWPKGIDQTGKKQGVFPVDDEVLVVLSPLEMKVLAKKKFINYKQSYKKLFKREAYYIAS